MDIDFEIELFSENNGQQVCYYSILVTIKTAPGIENFKKGRYSFDSTLNAQSGNYELCLYLEKCDGEEKPESSISYAIELGYLPSLGVDCGIEIHAMFGNLRLGGGIPKLASATQVSKG